MGKERAGELLGTGQEKGEMEGNSLHFPVLGCGQDWVPLSSVILSVGMDHMGTEFGVAALIFIIECAIGVQ